MRVTEALEYCVAAGIAVIAFLGVNYFVGNFAIHSGENEVRSTSRWHYSAEDPNKERGWVEGADDSLGRAKTLGTIAGLAAGTAAGIAGYSITRKMQGN